MSLSARFRGQGHGASPVQRRRLRTAVLGLLTMSVVGTAASGPLAAGSWGLGCAEARAERWVPSQVAERQVPGPPRELTGKDGRPMVLVPAGEFMMGSPAGEGEKDERPQHRVWVDAVYLDKHEVSLLAYEQFLEATGHARPVYWPYEEVREYAGRPVVGVSWYDAVAYCEWADKRLPTEAEWEHAARGNDGRPYPWGTGKPTPQIANFGKSWSHQFYEDRLKPVDGQTGGASPFGIHHMGGNVWEWVADWYDGKYYERSPKNNPLGPSEGSEKVVRGGSWNFAAQYTRTMRRLRYPPEHQAADLGFRCARDVEQAE